MTHPLTQPISPQNQRRKLSPEQQQAVPYQNALILIHSPAPATASILEPGLELHNCNNHRTVVISLKFGTEDIRDTKQLIPRALTNEIGLVGDYHS